MTVKDHNNIQNLYYFHRFTKASIAKLYGLSHQRIGSILEQSTFVINSIECMLCGVEDIIKPYYIDNNEDNHNPQNIIMLCQADRRKIIHLQLRRIKSQSLFSQLEPV